MVLSDRGGGNGSFDLVVVSFLVRLMCCCVLLCQADRRDVGCGNLAGQEWGLTRSCVHWSQLRAEYKYGQHALRGTTLSICALAASSVRPQLRMCSCKAQTDL